MSNEKDALSIRVHTQVTREQNGVPIIVTTYIGRVVLLCREQKYQKEWRNDVYANMDIVLVSVLFTYKLCD